MPSDFSLHVRQLRARLHLTQQGLASLLHVQPQVVASWEQGRRDPSAHNCQQMAVLAPPAEAWYFLGKIGITRELVRSKWLADAVDQPAASSGGSGTGSSEYLRVREAVPSGATAPARARQVHIPIVAQPSADGLVHDLETGNIANFVGVPAELISGETCFYAGLYAEETERGAVRTLLIVDPAQRDPARLRGKWVAALVDGKVLLRKLGWGSRGDRIELAGDSPEVPEIVLQAPEVHPVLGEVMMTWRREAG